MKKLILVLIFSSFTCGLFAHHYLVDEHTNSLNIEADISKYSPSYRIQASLGYTVNGRLSFDAHFSHVPYGASRNELHTSLGSDLSYLILRQGSGESPLNLELASSYDLKIDKYSLDLLSRSHVVGIGTYLSHRLILDENLSIIPSAGLKWENEYIKYLTLPEGCFGPMPTHKNSLVATLQGTVKFKRFYTFITADFSADASSWDRIYLFYADVLNLGVGIIL